MTSPAAGSARRPAPASAPRRWTGLVLAVGTALAILSLFGPHWLARSGVLVALATALGSTALAWRELRVERRSHAAAVLGADRAHGEQLREERRHNAVVVDTLAQRAKEAGVLAETRRHTIDRLTGEVGRLQLANSGLRAENSTLRDRVADRDRSIAELRAVMAAEEDAGNGANDGEETAEVHRMPRRSLTEPAASLGELDAAHAADDRRVVDLHLPEATVTLPNYEGDRRFA